MGMDAKTLERIEAARAVYMSPFVAAFRVCESPIEATLVAEMFRERWVPPNDTEHTTFYTEMKLRSLIGWECDWQMLVSPGGTRVAIQALFSTPEGKVRYDFLFHACMDRWLAVELDGHDFHDRTKEQAKRDRARDRATLRTGVPTIRFTGAEVYANPEAVLDEIVDSLYGLPEPSPRPKDPWETER